MPKRVWTGALIGAVGIHLGVAAFILLDPPSSGVQNHGEQGIEIGLGPSGGTPGQQTEANEETLEVEPLEELVTEPKTIEPETVELVEAAPVEDAPEIIEVVEEIMPPVEPDAISEELAEIIAEIAAVEEFVEEVPALEPPAPEIVREAVPVPRLKPRPPTKPDPPQAVVAQPQPQPVARETEPIPTPEETAAQPTPAAPPPPSAPEGSKAVAGEGASQNKGSETDTSAGGSPGATRDYFTALQVWLERHKEYPRSAKLRRQQGTAILHFEMDRQGNVLSYEIRESSGYRLLDREVENMIKRAQPLPRFPAEMAQATLKITVPVNFSMR